MDGGTSCDFSDTFNKGLCLAKLVSVAGESHGNKATIQRLPLTICRYVAHASCLQVRRIEGNDPGERFGLELAGALSRLERVMASLSL